MPLHAATHPLIAHKMNILRDAKTSTADFRRVLREITFYLGYEASRDLKSVPEKVITPMAQEFVGSKIGERIAIIPILRAGLGMCDAMLELFPRASVHHIGKFVIIKNSRFLIYLSLIAPCILTYRYVSYQGLSYSCTILQPFTSRRDM